MRKLFVALMAMLVFCCKAQSPIDRIEYFFNSDPGIGNATVVSLASVPDISDLNFSADASTLLIGFHRLYVRSHTADGKWSLTTTALFHKLAASNTTANINKIEYYFNTDPGFDNALDVPLTHGSDVSNFNFLADATALPSGMNRLYVRSQDASGKWSLTATALFYKSASPVIAGTITKVEYFVDTDPGIGNAVPLVSNAANNIPDFNFPVNITGLTAGRHYIYLRSRDSLGKWSLTARDTVQITSPVSSPAIIVNSMIINPPGSILGSRSTNINSNITLCAGKEIRLAFDPSGVYNPGNLFAVQLSDAAGAFTNAVPIGQVSSVKGTAIIVRLPRHLTPGSNNKIRVVSSSPVVIGDPGANNLTINDINVGADTIVYHDCVGETTNLLQLYNAIGFTIAWNTASPATAPPGMYSLIANNATNCPDTAFAIVKLETATWLGTNSSDWHTAANWSVGKVPTDKTHVIITGTTPNPCIISTGNAQAASIQVRNGGTVNAINNRLADVSGKCLMLPAN